MEDHCLENTDWKLCMEKVENEINNDDEALCMSNDILCSSQKMTYMIMT